jgi:hypothetical protein
MPASPSSPTRPLVDQLLAVADDHEVASHDPLAVLSQVPDTPARRGVRHQMTTIREATPDLGVTFVETKGLEPSTLALQRCRTP